MDDLAEARAEAVQEVASSILKAAGNAMTRHGSDPQSGAIVAAGFAMALRGIGEHIDPQITKTVSELLTSA